MSSDLLDDVTPGDDAVRMLELSATDADLLCVVAGERGYSCSLADLAGCHDKDEFLARMAEALDFPDWFGRNWDAFFDCLTDLSWLPAGGHVLVLLNSAEMQRLAPEAFDTAISIMRDAASVWAGRRIVFRVFAGVAPPVRAAKKRARRRAPKS